MRDRLTYAAGVAYDESGSREGLTTRETKQMGIGIGLHTHTDSRRRDEMSAARVDVRAARQMQRRQRQRQQDAQRRASRVARPSLRIPNQP